LIKNNLRLKLTKEHGWSKHLRVGQLVETEAPVALLPPPTGGAANPRRPRLWETSPISNKMIDSVDLQINRPQTIFTKS